MIIVRELRADDNLEAVLKLCRDFFHEYEEHHEDFFDLDNLTDDDISGRFVQSITSEYSATLLAIENDEVVGYASLVIREQPRFYKIKEVGEISALMVPKAHRRKGIATRLMREADAWFRKHNLRYYTFFTAVANRGATKFYERLGMQPIHISFLGDTSTTFSNVQTSSDGE